MVKKKYYHGLLKNQNQKTCIEDEHQNQSKLKINGTTNNYSILWTHGVIVICNKHFHTIQQWLGACKKEAVEQEIHFNLVSCGTDFSSYL